MDYQQSVSPFQTVEVVFYASVFLMAWLAAVSQTLRGDHFVSCRHSLNLGMVSGFLAFTVVSFVDGIISDRVDDPFIYLGVAALIGLSVRYQDRLIRSVLNTFVKKFNMEPINWEAENSYDNPRMMDNTGSEPGSHENE